MTDYVYCKIGQVVTTPTQDKTVKRLVACACTGKEVASFLYEDQVPSYTGALKSPLQITSIDVNNKGSKSFRGWVKDAAEYHKIPHVLLALILQNENNPNASTFMKVGQVAERSLQTISHIADEAMGGGVIWQKPVKGATGIVNINNVALQAGVKHSIEKYARPPIPSSKLQNKVFNMTDSRIAGNDWRTDLYYAAAHLRYLIDREIVECFNGAMNLPQLRNIIRAYNGHGTDAENYANAAVKNLELAISGKGVLYFYEK